MEIGARSRLGFDVRISSGVKVGSNCRVGRFVHLGKHVCVEDNVKIADTSIIAHFLKVTQKNENPNHHALMRPPQGTMYQLKDGKCQLVYRLVCFSNDQAVDCI